jgi:DNA polymerase-1
MPAESTIQATAMEKIGLILPQWNALSGVLTSGDSYQAFRQALREVGLSLGDFEVIASVGWGSDPMQFVEILREAPHSTLAVESSLFHKKIRESNLGAGFLGKAAVGQWLPFLDSHFVFILPTLRWAGDTPRSYYDLRNALEVLKRGPSLSEVQTEVTVVRDPLLAIIQIEVLQEQGGLFALDLETSSLNPNNGTILAVSVSGEEGKATVFLGESLNGHGVRQAFREWFLDPRTKWVFHNGHFDLLWLRAKFGFAPKMQHDTRLMFFALQEFSTQWRSLKNLGRRVLGVKDWSRKLDAYLASAGRKSYRFVPTDMLGQYAGSDADITRRLVEPLHSQVKADNKDSVYRFSVLTSDLLAEVDRRGVWIDLEYLSARKSMWEYRLKEISEEVCSATGIAVQLSSAAQVSALLYDHLKMPVVVQTKKGNPSVAKDALRALSEKFPDHPVLKLINEHRKITKYLGTYLSNYFLYAVPIPGTPFGKLFCDTRIDGTVTGRLAQNMPGVLTTPRDPAIRHAFVAPPGHSIVSADYSQNELRASVFYHRAPAMVKLMREGHDFHTAAAIILFGENFTKEDRVMVKGMNFAYAFTGSVKGAFGSMTTEQRRRAEKVQFEYDRKFPEWKQWFQAVLDEVRQTGRIQTPTGRTRHFPCVNARNEYAVMKEAANGKCQILSNDMTLLAALEVERRLQDFSLRWIMHDAITGYCPSDKVEQVARGLKRIMEEVGNDLFAGVIPAKADVAIGPDWGSLKDFDVEGDQENV